MITKLASLICTKLVNNKKIQTDETELYTYGLFLLLSSCFFTIASILFGIMFNCVCEVLIFYVAFRAIRSFSGGYHADTEIRCEISTLLTFFFVTIIIHLSGKTLTKQIIISLTVLAIPLILIFAPLDTPAKPLDTDEKKKYRKISLLILSIIVLIIIVSIIFKIKLLFVPCCLSLILESILLVAGVIKGRLVNGN